MEIAPGIHRIQTPLEDRFVCLFLLVGDRGALLIDSGLDSTPREHLAPYLDSVGVAPATIRWVITSHADFDHTAGNRSVSELAPGAAFMCHRLDQSWVEDIERMIEERYWEYAGDHGIADGDEVKAYIRSNARHVPMDMTLTGGETIRLGDDWELQVLHTPGHTRGHLSVYDPRSKTLIIADASLANAVLKSDGSPAFPPTYRYVDGYVASANRLLGIPADLLLTSHYAPQTGDQIAEFLHETRSYVDRVDEAIRDELVAAGEPRTMKQLIDALGRKLGEWPAPFHSYLVFPFAGHLERMVQWGLVETSRIDGRMAYRWIV